MNRSNKRRNLFAVGLIADGSQVGGHHDENSAVREVFLTAHVVEYSFICNSELAAAPTLRLFRKVFGVYGHQFGVVVSEGVVVSVRNGMNE